MLMKAAPDLGGAAPSLLPPHVLGWATRMFALYLGAALTAMVAGTGVLYVGHLVQPPDQWPDFRPSAPGQPASQAQVVPAAVPHRPPSDLPAIPVATLGKTESLPLRLADAPAGTDEPDGPGQKIDEQELRRTQLLAAMRVAGFAKASGTSSPFTLFAPSDNGFDHLVSEAAREKLPAEGKAGLRQLLAGHVVAGDYSLERLRSDLKQPGDHLSLRTLSGNTLMVTPLDTGSVLVRDAEGREVVMAALREQPKDGLQVFDQIGLPWASDIGAR